MDHRVGSGTVIGEVAFFDGQPRSADIVACGDVELLVLSYETFERLADADPALAQLLLLDLGLAGSLPIDAGGVSVAPRKVLGECLVRSLPADEPDLVFVRVEIRGAMDEGTRTLRYDIVDKFDEVTKLSAMMRTTAFPASIIAQMMARGDTLRRGATPQEVANVILFLASDKASWVSGAVVPVDGGFLHRQDWF